ncbi:MAG: hypothetical protein R3309_09715, partial [Reinekea sp.]|nr:hypothetical protein [Reinekea sp.]
FVARFGALPNLPLSANGRLSVRPCTRGAYKGIHALETVATCQISQPKQMRRNGYLLRYWQWFLLDGLGFIKWSRSESL